MIPNHLKILLFILLTTISTPGNSQLINPIKEKQQKEAAARKAAAAEKARQEKLRILAAFKSTDMVFIPGGTFTMGSPTSEPDRYSEETQHTVTVSSFRMSKYEGTFSQYDIFCNETGKKKKSDEDFGRGNHPVINISWNDATAFCKWLSKISGITYRLPTEAEWEYACRAGNTSSFNTGNSLTTTQANFDGDELKLVGSFAPNAWGLYDMHGNVKEWCSDFYQHGYYRHSALTNPTGPKTSSEHVLRGSGYSCDAHDSRCAMRDSGSPEWYNMDTGFRLVSPI